MRKHIKKQEIIEKRALKIEVLEKKSLENEKTFLKSCSDLNYTEVEKIFDQYILN